MLQNIAETVIFWSYKSSPWPWPWRWQQIILQDTPTHDYAQPYQVWPQKVKWFRRCLAGCYLVSQNIVETVIFWSCKSSLRPWPWRWQQIILQGTPTHDYAQLYQVWPQKVQWFRRCLWTKPALVAGTDRRTHSDPNIYTPCPHASLLWYKDGMHFRKPLKHLAVNGPAIFKSKTKLIKDLCMTWAFDKSANFTETGDMGLLRHILTPWHVLSPMWQSVQWCQWDGDKSCSFVPFNLVILVHVILCVCVCVCVCVCERERERERGGQVGRQADRYRQRERDNQTKCVCWGDKMCSNRPAYVLLILNWISFIRGSIILIPDYTILSIILITDYTILSIILITDYTMLSIILITDYTILSMITDYTMLSIILITDYTILSIILITDYTILSVILITDYTILSVILITDYTMLSIILITDYTILFIILITDYAILLCHIDYWLHRTVHHTVHHTDYWLHHTVHHTDY